MTSATKGWGYEFVTNVHYSYGNHLMSMVKRIIDFIFTCLDFFFLIFRSEASRVAPIRCIFFLGPSNRVFG